MKGYDEDLGQGVLGELESMARLALEAKQAMDEAEAEFKYRAGIYNRYIFKSLPEIIERAGGRVGSEVIIDLNGERIPLKLEEKMKAKLSDAKRETVIAYMKQVGAEDLINNNVVVGFTRGQQEQLRNFLENIEQYNAASVDKVSFGVKEEIHPSTYTAWCDDNLKDNPSVNLADFGAHLVKQVSFGKPKSNKSKGKR